MQGEDPYPWLAVELRSLAFNANGLANNGFGKVSTERLCEFIFIPAKYDGNRFVVIFKIDLRVHTPYLVPLYLADEDSRQPSIQEQYSVSINVLCDPLIFARGQSRIRLR